MVCRYQIVTKFSPTDRHSVLKSFILIRAEGETTTAFGFLVRTLPPPLSRITLGSKGIEKFYIYNKMQTPRAEKAQKLQAFSALTED